MILGAMEDSGGTLQKGNSCDGRKLGNWSREDVEKGINGCVYDYRSHGQHAKVLF